MDNRPQGRQKHITGQGKEIRKQGSGLGTGPVGRPQGSYQQTDSAPGARSTTTRSGGGGLLKYIIIAVILLGGGGAGLSGLLGSGNSATTTVTQPSYTYTEPASSGSSSAPSSSGGSLLSGAGWSSFMNPGVGSTTTGWSADANVRRLDTSVAPGARAKRTTILGNGRDTVTIMVYMCGADLESKSGMATSDLSEMASATLSDKLNVIVYTGGSTKWQNNVVSSSANQIYKVEQGGLRRLVDNAGNGAMTAPDTLTGFIQYCTKNYPANRQELIFWDHGGGSISGYGYDEKHASSGSMSLKNINQALANAGTTFDFIGFDTCLMATTENALMLSSYADYLVASEETEPGIGWYYKDWLTKFAANTSMSTLEVGKNIVDDFVNTCAQKCSGQKATLAVIDLAELEKTLPDKFKSFATSTSEMITSDDFQAVSTARSSTREFASSSRIDQVDFVDLAYRLDTDESKALASALLGAVKYNNVSSNMTNAYGLSIYFPYQKTSNVNTAVQAYQAIGLDDDYARCIQQFASMEVGGQSVSGGYTSPFSLFSGTPEGYTAQGGMSTDMISSLLGQLIGGSSGFGRSLDIDDAAAYLAANRFDAGSLLWKADGGTYTMTLPEDQWSLVNDLTLNVFFDDGEGYIDLGCDNVFDFTDDGALIGAYDGTWLAVDGQPVAYYYLNTTVENGDTIITGRIPVLINDDRADLIIVFDDAHPYGYIAGARYDYIHGETETVAKGMTELSADDEIRFVADYYAYDGVYQNSYLIGGAWHYHDGAEISNVYIDASAAVASYLFTDIYHQSYWTPVIPG